MVTFRSRLLATIEASRPLLDLPGAMIVGSQVPNLLEPGAASTLVVSLDLDIAVSVSDLAEVVRLLAGLDSFRPSPEEPSVLVPRQPELLEINLLGSDPMLLDPLDAYQASHEALPLLVFGGLALLAPAEQVMVDGRTVPVARSAGLLIEKLLTDRSGEKGERDLMVALASTLVGGPDDRREAVRLYRSLTPDHRYSIRANLALLALLPSREGLPEPVRHRGIIVELLEQLEETEQQVST